MGMGWVLEFARRLEQASFLGKCVGDNNYIKPRTLKCTRPVTHCGGGEEKQSLSVFHSRDVSVEVYVVLVTHQKSILCEAVGRCERNIRSLNEQIPSG